MKPSDSKNASKQTAKPAAASAPKPAAAKTVQLDFLPQAAAYPAELVGRKEPVVQVGGASWIRRESIVNPPDATMNRYTKEEWQGQMHSFRTLGIKTAIHVRPVEGGYWMEDGRHRFLGAAELGRDYLKADIDAKGTAATSAVWRLEANSRRKGDRPLDEALTYQEEMLEGKLTQAQISAVHEVSQATVSRRLRLVHDNFPRDLARRVGNGVDEKSLEPIFDVLEDKALMEAAGKAILAVLNDPKTPKGASVNAWAVAERAWTSGDKPLALPADHDAFHYDVVHDKAWNQALPKFGAFIVKVPDTFNAGKTRQETFYRNADVALKVAQEITDRLDAEREAEEAKLAAKAAKQGKKVVDGRVVEAPKKRSVAERTPEQATKVQLDLLARHVPAQVSFPEDMTAEALARFVGHTAYLQSGQDREACRRALGLPEPKDGERESTELTREAFLARWKKDRPAAMRMVAVALYFQARDHSKQLKDERHEYGEKGEAWLLPKWTTGHTYEQATELARQAVKDRDAGFKTVVDGALCDHCDKPATLRKGGTNVCRSDVFKEITPTKLAARRMARAESTRANEAAGAKEASNGPAKNGAAKAKPGKTGKSAAAA